MSLIVADRVQETTNTTGTGAYTLGGVVPGFRTFASVASNADTVYYSITDNTNYEVGLGTYASSGGTIARTTVFASSNSNNAVNWGSGTKNIFLTYPADKAVIEDASNNVTIGNNLVVGGTVDGVDIAARDAVLTSTTTTANAALPKAGGAMTGAITTNSTFDGRDVATDGTKLDTIETNADVTDTANVTAAGALMDSELTNLAAVKAINQSLVTSASPTFAGLTAGGNIAVTGTVDGRDVASDGTKLDTVETNADVTDTANVTSAGALMDSEVDADIKTLVLPANTTISAYGKTIIDDANASAARTTLGVAIGSNVQAYSSVLENTTASFLTADETKIDYITVTQAVDLDQMETDIAALANGMVYKGNWDASAGSFPGGGSAQTGWFYYVSVAGTVNSISFAVGDNIVATTDNASTSTYASNWSKHDQTDAVQAVVGLTGSISKSGLLSALNVEDGADVTDATNVTAAGALMDSEVDADIKTLVLPANTTITAYGRTLVDDADASTARSTLGLGTAATTAASAYATAAQGTKADAALPKAGGAMTGAITTNSTFDGRDVATDGAKLDNIEANADVTDTTNVTSAGALMDSEVTNLAQVKAFDSSDYATAAQGTKADAALPLAGGTLTGNVEFGSGNKAKFGASNQLEIYAGSGDAHIKESGSANFVISGNNLYLTNTDQTKRYFLGSASTGKVTLYYASSEKFATTSTGATITGDIAVSGTVDGRDVATDGTKLDGIEASADVTDTANVTSAGALMDSEVTNLAQVKAFDSSDYATAAQGTKADAALPKAGGAMTGAITTNSTFDGRDVATDGTKLDGIEASADVTDTANVTAAGALMDSEVDADIKTLSLPANTTISAFGRTLIDDAAASNARTTLGLGTAATTAASAYATAAQGTKADAALPKAGGAMTGAITTNSTFDGRDVATDGAKLDGIASGATNVTNNNQLTNGAGYTTNVGDITNVSAGVGLSGGGSSGSVTLTLDMSELTDMTATMVGTDEFIVLDASADRRKAANEIGLSIFNNDAGFTTNVGDITGVTAGSGISGGGTSGTVTVSHSDTSSQASLTALTGAAVVSDIDLDTYGHVTNLATRNITLANLGYTGATNANNITNNNQLTNGAGYTTNTGDITGVTAGTNLNGGGSSGAVTLNLDSTITVTTVNAGTVNTTSDERAKEDITPITGALDKVQQLGGYSFTLKATDEKSSGVIAQEVQKVMPELVQEGAEGLLSVQYGNMVGLLIEAIKEQQAQIDELKQKLNG